RISPVLGSMATRSSRAGPTAFLAAESRASCTAEVRTSRLMPFSFSQYSRTAKKSAFIDFRERHSHLGNKKVGKFDLSDFGALANQQFFTVRAHNKFLKRGSQAAIPASLTGVSQGKPPENFCNFRS